MQPTLGQAIDKAVKEQYPNGNQPTLFQRLRKKSEKDRWVEHFDLQLRDRGLVPQKEHRFHPERMWRFDYAWVEKKIAVEIDGGSFGRVVVCHQCKQPVKRFLKSGGIMLIREGSGHNTGPALNRDHEKFNEAVKLGWRVYHFTPERIKDHSAIDFVASVLGDH